MKIAFDHQIFMQQSFGGISRYFTMLAQELAQNHEVKIIAPLNKNKYLSDIKNKKIITGYTLEKFPPRSSPFVNFFNTLITSNYIKNNKFDIIHETYYSTEFIAKNTPRVITVYDMIHELFPHEMATKDKTAYKKKIALNKADHIISISHSTKNDLINLLGIPEEKITVIHLAATTYTPLSQPKKSTLSGKPYILYVGARGGYKNFLRLLQAYSKSRVRNDLNLIAFGGGQFTNIEKKFVAELGLSEKVIQISGNDIDLINLYRNAIAMIYPSLYEGFGLPPLEAMTCGCPVISSNTSSMPEVIDSAAEYFDPYNIDDMGSAIEQVIYDEIRRAELRDKGYSRVKNFSWSRCAKETEKVYKNVLK